MILMERNEPDVIEVRYLFDHPPSVNDFIYQEFDLGAPSLAGVVVGVKPERKTVIIELENKAKMKEQVRKILKKRKQTSAPWKFVLFAKFKLYLGFRID